MVLKRRYHLDVPLSALAERCDPYEALSRAWWKKHPSLIKKALNQLKERIYLIDYTEDTMKEPAFRVFVAGLADHSDRIHAQGGHNRTNSERPASTLWTSRPDRLRR